METSHSGNTKVNDLLNNGPEFTGNSKIDKYFQRLNEQILSVESSKSGDLKDDTYSMVLVDRLVELNGILVSESSNDNTEHSDLIPISLNDMKLLESLMNLIIVHSIYRYLPNGYGIPLDQRNLSNRGETYTLVRVSNDKVLHTVLYKLIGSIFPRKTTRQGRSVLCDILLKGSGYSDILVGLLYLDSDQETYEYMESLQSTYNLFEMYTTLYQSGNNLQFQNRVLDKLSTLTVRRESDGLYSLIEFILGLRENIADQEIELSKFNKVNEVVCNKPKYLSNVQYYIKIFKQILKIFTDNLNNDAMINSTNNIVTEFFFKNPKIVNDFLFKQIYFKLFNLKKQDYSVKQTNDIFNILIALSKQSSNDIVISLIENCNEYDFFFAIWRYTNFIKMNQTSLEIDDSYYKTILVNLIKNFMAISDKYYILNYIILNFNTNRDKEWGKLCIDLESKLVKISISETNLKDELNLESTKNNNNNNNNVKLLQDTLLLQDSQIELLISLLKTVNDNTITKDLFLTVFNRWCRLNNDSTMEDTQEYDNVLMLSDLKLLEKFNEEFKSDLISEPSEILNFIDNVLKIKDLNTTDVGNDANIDDEDSDDEDDVVASANNNANILNIVLQLLSTILTTNSGLCKYLSVLESIQAQLTKDFPGNVQCQTIVQRIDEEVVNYDKNKDLPKVNDESNESTELQQDRAFLKKCIMNINDPLIPIRAQGLVMLRELLLRKSQVVDYKFVLDLHLLQLQDKDPFIYLNVIKGLTSLCSVDLDSLKYLIELYDNQNRKTPLDEVLKIGEVLVNHVELSTQNAFIIHNSEIFHSLIQVCLQKINVSTQNILENQGITDDRLRMSSMSILGVILQKFASDLADSEINDILDCSFGILKFEKETADFAKSGTGDDTETTKKLMRRSAVHIIHDLLYNSGFDRFPQQYQGTNLVNLLNYTRSQDTDFLTCELIDKLLALIDEIIKDSLTIHEIDNSLMETLKIVKH